MPVTVEIPSPLRGLSGGASSVAVEGGTVRTALAHLVSLHPDLKSKLFDGAELRPYVNVFVNDEDIRYLDELDTAVASGQIVALIPAVAGG